MTIWQTIDANAIKRLKEIYDRYNVQRIINARDLDFKWRKDGREGTEEADAIKDLLRYLPALIAKAEANPDLDYVSPPIVTDAAGSSARPSQS